MPSDENTPKVTPRLRFPEFREKDWREVRLGQLGELVSGLTYSPEDVRDEGLLVLRSSNILNGEIALKDCVFVRYDISGANLSKPNDILICVRNGSKALIGKNALIPEGMPSRTHGAFMTVFRTESAQFVFQLLQTKAYQTQVAGDLGATINSINGSQLRQYRFVVPEMAEQQKIAACLTSLDEVIAAQRRKVAALAAHKWGLMQQLFPREGGARPRLRFPEFRDAPEWEDSSLDACFSHIRNGFVGTATPFYVDGGIPYLQGKNVKRGQIDPKGLVTVAKDFHVKQKNSQLRHGDIVMVQSGHVGECAFVGDAYVGANCHALIIMTPLSRQHSPFFVHCFGSDYGVRLISQITTGNTIKHILASDMKALVVRIPQLAEQQRIAACFSALDAQIAAESDKFAVLKTHKKGLMQQLFLLPGEGSTRVCS